MCLVMSLNQSGVFCFLLPKAKATTRAPTTSERARDDELLTPQEDAAVPHATVLLLPIKCYTCVPLVLRLPVRIVDLTRRA